MENARQWPTNNSDTNYFFSIVEGDAEKAPTNGAMVSMVKLDESIGFTEGDWLES